VRPRPFAGSPGRVPRRRPLSRLRRAGGEELELPTRTLGTRRHACEVSAASTLAGRGARPASAWPRANPRVFAACPLACAAICEAEASGRVA